MASCPISLPNKFLITHPRSTMSVCPGTCMIILYSFLSFSSSTSFTDIRGVVTNAHVVTELDSKQLLTGSLIAYTFNFHSTFQFIHVVKLGETVKPDSVRKRFLLCYHQSPEGILDQYCTCDMWKT